MAQSQTIPHMLATSPVGHPFRRTLPATTPIKLAREDNDLKLFVLSFTAFFICIYSFIF